MKEKLTCPFTGMEFIAEVKSDGSLTWINPLTDEVITAKNLPLELFSHIEIMTPKQTADYLGVTKQRISQIVKRETIPVHYVAGKPMFLKLEVDYYARSRKVGAPRKDEKC